jgi:hypothetical protein
MFEEEGVRIFEDFAQLCRIAEGAALVRIDARVCLA